MGRHAGDEHAPSQAAPGEGSPTSRDDWARRRERGTWPVDFSGRRQPRQPAVQSAACRRRKRASAEASKSGNLPEKDETPHLPRQAHPPFREA